MSDAGEHAAAPQAAVRRSLTARLAPGAGLAVFALAIWAIHGELQGVHVRDIARSFHDLAPSQAGWAVLLTIASYLMLCPADWLAAGYAGRRPPFPRAAFAAASAYAVSNAVGFGPFSANAVRLRLYGAWDVDARAVAIIAVVTGAAMYLGAVAAAGIGLVAASGGVAAALGGGPPIYAVLGVGLAAAAASAVVIVTTRKKPIGWRDLTLARPATWTPAVQLLAATADWMLTAGVLWVLLPIDVRPDFLAFTPIFVLAGLIGALTGLPGGLGAFDAVIVLLAPHGAEQGYLAALLVYRIIYFAGPLLVVGGALGWSERRGFSGALVRSHGAFASLAQAVAPAVFALLVFAAGALVLLSVATPALPARLNALNAWLPLGLIEASHFAASILALVLLVLASGLQRRLRRAWALAVALCAIGGVLALLKGFDWEEALFLGVLAVLIALSKPAFYRTTPEEVFRTPHGWMAATAGALLFAAWAGFVSYRHIPYSGELWWAFVIHGDASRFLRALAGVSVAFLLFALWRWLSSAPAPLIAFTSDDVARVKHVLATAEVGHCDANLALLGDKRLLFSPSGESFVQFGVRGRTWITMGEPVGKADEIRDLLWRFREAADRAGATPIFYAVRREALGDLAEIGLVAQKIGETAVVPLSDFSLEGSKRAPLRHERNRAIRADASFEVVPVDAVPGVLPELRAVSDAWLAKHEGAEKGFSLGRFDESYLANFPLAVVRIGGEPAAFANLWSTPDKRELSIDLMRYGENAPHGVMDYLFTELALWGRDQGYETLDLGMAPLSGLDGHRLAPLLSRVGAFIYDVGEHVYGFEGLRRFKDKYHPSWEPLFLAAPGRLVLPFALGAVALLTSGGVLGLLGHGRARRA